jgi:predicted ATPase
MNKDRHNTVRFERLKLCNYGIFQEMQEFSFKSQKTIILGPNGTGKSTIVGALSHLGPDPIIKPNIHSENKDMTVDVELSGKSELVKKYNKIIFINEHLLARRNKGFDYITNLIDEEICDEHLMRQKIYSIFEKLLARKPWKIEAHKDLSSSGMAQGELFCLSFAMIFAARSILKLDLPIVLDSPYSVLDNSTRTGVRDYLAKQDCQKIILLTEPQLEDDNPTYILEI